MSRPQAEAQRMLPGYQMPTRSSSPTSARGQPRPPRLRATVQAVPRRVSGPLARDRAAVARDRVILQAVLFGPRNISARISPGETSRRSEGHTPKPPFSYQVRGSLR
eukprot:2459975-Rhodomonas_salina.4